MTTQVTVPASKGWGLSASTLKIIACILMVVDHLGAILLPQYMILRVIGRLSYPIFAYFIAEGCRYTRNKTKRFFLVFGLAVICEGVAFLVTGEPDGGILVNFCMAILLIYEVQAFKRAWARKRWWEMALWLTVGLASVIGVYLFTSRVLYVDYGFWGILIPVWTILLDYREGEAPAWMEKLSGRWIRFAFFSLGLLLLCSSRGLLTNVQSFSLLSLPLLALYNGKPGRKGLKYGFYVFYPAHLAVLWGIAAILERL